MKYMTVTDVKDRWRIKQSDLETFERNKYTEDAAELRARRTGGFV